MYKFILIAAFIVFVISVSAQTTTAEEYDYLTRDFKKDMANGKKFRKGYELDSINEVYLSKSYAYIKRFYKMERNNKRKVAYLIAYKSPIADTEYFCYPNPYSFDGFVLMYVNQVYLHNPKDTIRLQCIDSLTSKLIYSFDNIAQMKSEGTNTDTTQPQFMGGDRGWNLYLQTSVIHDIKAAPLGFYKVNATYTINENGEITDVKALNSPGFGMSENLVNLIKKSPVWIPATFNGRGIKYKGYVTKTFRGILSNAHILDSVIHSKWKPQNYDSLSPQKQWQTFVMRNLDASIPYKNGAPAGKYKVDLSFFVNEDGSISDVTADNDPGYGAKEECLRMMKYAPKKSPILVNGVATRVKENKSIVFDVSEESTHNKDYERIYTNVEVEPTFPGGSDAWHKYLEKNLNTSIPTNKGAPPGKYTVNLNFTVSADGTLKDINANRSPYGTSEEAYRVLKAVPHWIPAKLEGKDVAYRTKEEITFIVPEEEKILNEDTIVDKEPEFPGGRWAWSTYLSKNLNSNVLKANGAPVSLYDVELYFLVDKDGSIKYVHADPYCYYGTAEEAIRVLKSGPKWIPAVKNGQNVANRVEKTIRFYVEAESPIKNTFNQINIMQQDAHFPGGSYAWKYYVERNIKKNLSKEYGAAPGIYTVMVSLLVDKEGNINDVKADPAPYGIEAEAIRLISEGPNWIPAKQNNKNVASKVKLSLTLIINENHGSKVP